MPDAPSGLKVITTDPGETAYEIALRHGFIGTEQEWLDSLIGSTGTIGLGLVNRGDWLSGTVYNPNNYVFATSSSGSGTSAWLLRDTTPYFSSTDPYLDTTHWLESLAAPGVGFVPASRTITTQYSLTGGGDLSANRTLNLVGDVASPGNNKVYGTDGAGTRGWYAVAAGSGDTISDETVSVDSQLALYSGITGKHIKKSTASGRPLLTAGVLSVSAVDLSSGDATGTLAAARFPALTGDVTTVAGNLAATIANDAVTYAKMQNISAVSKLIGRGSLIGAGDPEEITLGTNLTMTGTTLSATGGSPGGSNTYVQFNDGGVFGGDADLTWDKTNNVLSIAGSSVNTTLRVGGLESQSYAVNNAWMSDNMYFDGTNFRYRNTGTAVLFYFYGGSGQGEGQFRLYPTATAGSTTGSNDKVQFKINADGSVGIGGQQTTTPGAYTNSLLLVKGATTEVGIAGNYKLGFTSTSADASAALDTYFNRSAAGVMNLTSILDVATGFRIGGGAASGNVLRGNATNFVSAQLAFSDLAGDFALTQTPSLGADSLIGRGNGGGAGDWQAITLGSGLSMTGSVLSVSAGGGNVSNSGTPTVGQYARWVTATTIEGVSVATVKSDLSLNNVTNDAQTKASIVPNTAPSAGQILVGNAGGTAYAPVTMGTDATLASTGALTIANNVVTLAKMATIATDSILGRATAAAGNVEVLTALPFAFTGDVTRPVDSNAQTIANDAVTYAKMQNVSAASKLLGRGSAGGSGDPEEITVGSGLAMTGTTLSATGGTGDVVGPASATDNAIARFDSTTGKLIQNSAVTVSDTTPTFSTSATEMVFEQTGDTLGTSRFRLQNRGGSGGGLFENVGLDLAEFGFKPNTGPQANLRLEHRGASQFDSTANPHGEIHFVENSTGGASAVFSHVFGQAKSFLGGEIFLGTPTNSAATEPADTSFLRQAAGVTRFKNSLDVVTGYQVAGAALNFSHLAGDFALTQTPSAAVSKLIGRGSAAGAGDWQEITLGANLTMTGTTLSAAGGSGSPGGSDTQLQYNNGGAFGGVSTFTYDDVGDVITASPTIFYADNLHVGSPGNDGQFDTTALTTGRVITVPNANSTLVVSDAGAANNFLTGINGNGQISKAQPSFANLSGDFALTQTPSLAVGQLIGRGTAVGAGDWEAITIGGSLSFTGTTLSSVPSGSDTYVQFNDSGVFAGDSGLTWDKTNDALSVSGRVYAAATSASPGQGYYIGTSGTKLATFQSWNFGNTYTFFTNNKHYVTGTGWADLGNSRVGCGFQFEGNNTLFHSFDTGINETQNFWVGPNAVGLSSVGVLGFSASADPAAAKDTALSRNAAGILEINNGTAGQFKDLKCQNITTTGLISAAVGTTTLAPINIPAGTVKTTPVAGDREFDGVQHYATIDTTSKRGAIPVEQYFHLSADGSTISTIANFFGATSNISLVANAYYEIEIYCFFLNTTAGTVTWTFTNSAAPTSQDIIYEMSPLGGIVAPAGSAVAYLSGNIHHDATAAKALTTTGTLTTAVNHFAHFKIFLQNGTGTSLKIQATKLVGGTITPQRNSWWRCRRLSPNNIGTFAA